MDERTVKVRGRGWWIARATGALVACQLAALAGGSAAVADGAGKTSGGAACPSSGDPRSLSPDTRFFVPTPLGAATDQIASLQHAHQFADARRVATLESTPQAAWFASGSPHDVEKSVKETMRAAAAAGTVPGQSDGSCNRGVDGSTTDPEWGGIVAPPTGEWFPAQALQLATLANPSL